MSGLSRVVVSAALVASLGTMAQAQSRWSHSSATTYDGLAEGRSVDVDRKPTQSATVPPSMSHTVMGLSVPR